MTIITLVVFLLILSILVLIHEAGHFFVARKFGMKVEEFGFGFPLTAPIWQIKRGETLYSFYPVLIGGFVKLYGEDDAGGGKVSMESVNKYTGKSLQDAFYARPLMQRLLVIVAGVVMNVILAVVVYYAFLGLSNFKQELPLIGNPVFFGVNNKVTTQVVVSDIEKNSPAEKAGITPFSVVQSINSTSMSQQADFGSIIKANAGKPVSITWKDQKNVTHTASVTPRLHPPKNQGALGVGFFPSRTVTLSYDTPTQKLFSGFIHPANLMVYNYSALGYLINISVKEKNVAPVSQGVSGPVGIASFVGQILQIPDVETRLLQLLNLVGLLSMSLAVVNILPIPGLDGGRFFFIIVEAIIGKKMDPKVEGYIHAAGMVFLLALLFLVTVKDIFQFFPK